MAEEENIKKKRRNFPCGMVLRVLLVEADDSTRRIIAALLRKCSYRVAAVSDGLMAWEALKGRPNNIDLILTEVDLPSISGYALLTLIMEHEVCKNIPVIMMSSQDSISVVLKCMLKGAADFLIKPVRKNELRNLWQHVWRKKITALNTSDVELKEEATINKSAASGQSSDHLASTRKKNACSEEEIDAQGVSQIKSGNASDKSYIKGQEENVTLVEKSDIVKDVSEGTWPTSHTENDGNICEINCHADENVKPSVEAIDLIGKFESHLKDVNCQSNTNNAAEKIGSAPQLELSLRRSYASCSQDEGTKEWHRPHHSDVSAFSGYDNSKPFKPFPPTYTGTCTELKEAASCDSAPHGASRIDGQEVKDPLTSSSYSAKAEAAVLHTQFGFTPVASVSFDNLCAGFGTVLSPFHHPPLGISMVWNAKLAGQHEQIPSSLSNSIQSNSEIHKSGKNYCTFNEATSHPIGQIEDKNIKSRQSSRNGSPAPCMSNSEGCGSICNTVNGDANLPVAVSGASVTESINENQGIVHDGPRGIDSHHNTLREAALLKFRLKRKERSYEKKVRYESRKRIAEQRPRVKGQFVRRP